MVGFDFHKFPGAYGYQEVEGYALLQKIGVGLKVENDLGDAGTHTFNVSTFFQRYYIFKSFRINNDGKTRKSDGGVSNTEDFSSYSISLGGKTFSWIVIS